MKNNAFILIFLSILSGILLLFSWFKPLSFYLIFIAFVPLLSVVENLTLVKSKAVRIILLLLPFLIWNFNNAWIFKINGTACILAIIINTSVIAAPWLIYSVFQKRIRIPMLKDLFLIVSILSMEIFHQTWQLSYPFYVLGNTFSVAPELIQWYEYTGVYGGTIWILLSNILAFSILKNFNSYRPNMGIIRILLFLLLLVFPILLSKYTKSIFKPVNTLAVEVVAIHPQIKVPDKYNMNNENLLKHYLSISSIYTTPNTDYLIWPETAFPVPIFIDSLKTNRIVDTILTLYQNTDTKIITGLVLGEKGKPESGSKNYREYNAALYITPSLGKIDIKTKHKCVPFTERVPYPKILSFISHYVKGLAGYQFSTSEEYGKVNFISDKIRIVPCLCYESVFCNINMPKKIHENTFIAVMLNEGWYNNLRIAKQFMYFSVIRAIEYRKPVVRSSNMGISCVVSPYGECNHILTTYGEKGFNTIIQANSYSSFFARHRNAYEHIIITIFPIMILYFSLFKSKIFDAST